MVSIRTTDSGRRTSRPGPILRAGTVAAATVVVLAMSGPAMAAVPLTTISTDPYTNTSSYHQTQVEPDNYAFGSTIVGAFQSGRFTDGGASNIGWATSTDNGAHWSNGFLPHTTVYATPAGSWARISDPSVAYDAKHNVWMISGLALNASVSGKAVQISRSTDGGLSWLSPVTVSAASGASDYDKEWVACDNSASSSHYGNCYVEWDDFGLGNALRMSRSADGGLSWAPSTVPSAAVIGGQPLVQPDGTVIVPIDNAFESRVESFISSDGGSTYTGPFTIATISNHFEAGNLRSGPLPSAEIDAAGKAYVVWSDCRFRASCTTNDIVMSTTTDGTSWTPVVRIPITATTSGADFFIPGLGVDHSTSGSTAHLTLATYLYGNGACTTSTCKLYALSISSTDGGATWGTRRRLVGPLSLSWLPQTTLGYMVGDYISTAFAGGKAFPVLAKAQAGACTLGDITSCHEFMVAPTAGLTATGGTKAAGTERPVAGAHSDHAAGGAKTAR